MDEYVDSLAEVKEIRTTFGTEELMKFEMKQDRKMVEKFYWLAQSTRLDLWYTSLRIAKRNN